MSDSVKKKILVGGGAGYIGSMLVPKLIEAGHEVVVIDLLWFGNCLPKEAKVIQKDLFDCTEEDLRGFDEFIFLAGLSNDPMAEYSPSKNFIMNGALPSYLAYIAKFAGIKRFIYASSCSVYGFTLGKVFSEEDPAVSNYPYGISKYQGEKGVLQMADENFSVVVLRQGTVCGFGPRMRVDLIVNAMFKTALTENKVVVNNPDIWRPIYDLRDCVEVYLTVLKSPLSISGIFNVAADNFTVGEVGKIVRDTLQKLSGKEIALEIKNLPDKRNYKVSLEKARTTFNFTAKYSIVDIVTNLYNHLSEIGDLNQDRYYNIRMFSELARRDEIRKQKLDEIDKFKY